VNEPTNDYRMTTACILLHRQKKKTDQLEQHKIKSNKLSLLSTETKRKHERKKTNKKQAKQEGDDRLS